MEIVRGEQLAENYPELIERAAADERIIVSFAGHQVALVSFDDLAILEELDREQDKADVEEYRRTKADPTQTPLPFAPAALGHQAVR